MARFLNGNYVPALYWVAPKPPLAIAQGSSLSVVRKWARRVFCLGVVTSFIMWRNEQLENVTSLLRTYLEKYTFALGLKYMNMMAGKING